MSVPALDSDCALFCDLDGTLVEIADTPDAIAVAPGLPDLLRRLHRKLSGAVAVVSGRTIATVDALLDGAVPAVAGVHGLELRLACGARTIAPVSGEHLERARETFGAFARARPGVILEDKGVSLALHYRQAPALAEDCLRLAETALGWGGGLVLQQGKMVVELRGGGGNKGDAVTRFMADAPFRGRRPVFIGDDLTDEDSFRVVNACQGLSVRVGRAGTSCARHRLADVAAVHTWLATFADR